MNELCEIIRARNFFRSDILLSELFLCTQRVNRGFDSTSQSRDLWYVRKVATICNFNPLKPTNSQLGSFWEAMGTPCDYQNSQHLKLRVGYFDSGRYERPLRTLIKKLTKSHKTVETICSGYQTPLLHQIKNKSRTKNV